MASGPEGTDPLKHQTVALKISIHCEGCKKKVKKVLQRVEGVYDIDIDSKLNKVTVTGSADAESLIRKLLKYGKHAELWPETKPSTSNSSSTTGKPKAKGKEKDAATSVPKSPEAEQKLPNTEKKQQAEEGKPAPPPPAVTTAPSPAVQVAATSDDALKHNIDAAGEEPVKSEKPATKEESEDIKEKGKKVQRELTDGEERAVSDSDKPAAARSTTATIDSMSPPPQHPFSSYPQPMYTMSYNTAQPSVSYAYYTPAPEAAASSSYTAYSGYSPPAAYPPVNYSDSYYGSMEAPATSEGSYDMFNDENPNACNLM